VAALLPTLHDLGLNVLAFNRVFASLDRKVFAACFSRWMACLAAAVDLKAVVVDGKAVRAVARDTFSGCLAVNGNQPALLGALVLSATEDKTMFVAHSGRTLLRWFASRCKALRSRGLRALRTSACALRRS
jgi:hypothetical protein